MSAPSPPLPVSGRRVVFRPADGADDLVLQDAEGPAISVGLELVSRLATSAGGEEVDWSTLAVTDFEVLLLRLRERTLGSQIECKTSCPAAACRAPLEIPFRIEDYLAELRPRRPRGVVAEPERPGWFRAAGVGFRLPTVGDQIAVFASANPSTELAERCIDVEGRRGEARRRIETAMAAMAPEVSRPMAGQCPECQAAVPAFLHVPTLVVAELRAATRTVHDEVHLIASAYHWSEATIVAMPRRRRQHYAERISRQRHEAL